MRVAVILFVSCLTKGVLAQTVPTDSTAADTLGTVEMPQVVVTATRTDKLLEDVAVPITVVPMADMKRRGALRLGDALENIPGLMLADDHGTGLQIRGFDAEYTLILLDGEPIIGRTAGTLNVNRLAIEGLSHLEIISGPESSLYGSQALAGVVNLVSAAPQPGIRGSIGLRTGTHATTSLSGNISAARKNMGLRLRVNRYASSGYDLTPTVFGSTTPGFANYETDLRANLTVNPRLKLRLGIRASTEQQDGAFADASDVQFTEEGEQVEWSVHPEVKLKLSRQIQLTSTVYGARFRTDTRHVNRIDGSSTFADDFDQSYMKAEFQLDALWNSAHLTTVGVGAIREDVGGGRYSTGSEPSAGQSFGFVQQEWIPSRLMQINLSTRFDQHSDYSGRLTPKIAVLVRPIQSVRMRASVGSGFKAPALRQLYLSYTNAGAGYSVFGATQMVEGMSRLEAEGQLDEVFLDVSQLERIGAEHSTALNLGLSVNVGGRFSIVGDVFHNRVRDLIGTQPVARKTNGQFVYTYFNLARMYTRGLELSVNFEPLNKIEVIWSYHFLQARDLEVVDALKSGTVYGRSSDGREYRLNLADYTGLFGRSAHSSGLRVSFVDDAMGLTADIRAQWRSKSGLRDYDGNQIANRPDEFIPAFTLADATITKSVLAVDLAELELQAGIQNLLNRTNPASMPSLSGRTFFASLLIAF